MENEFENKKCKCPEEYWEIIVVDRDEYFDYKTTVYYHCDYCGEDFLIKNFETDEIIFTVL